MLKKALSRLTLCIALLCCLSACEDTTTTIGSVISTGEVEINLDTLLFNLQAKPVEIQNFDSKTGNLLVGNIYLENYGSLNCSFVTKLMCAANLNVPDSLFFPERVDSCKLVMGALRSNIVGDSLAPQILSVYRLNKQLPTDINNTFNPESGDYYSPSQPLATKSYTLSNVSFTDSTFYKQNYVALMVDLPREFGMEIFEKYKSDPEIFQWPQTMASEFLPGLYVKSIFGKGCVANLSSVYIAIFYHSFEEETITEDDETVTTVKKVNHMAVPFTVSPEVLSSNNINYLPARKIADFNGALNGEVVVTTPGGYLAQFDFPVQTLIDLFNEKDSRLSTVNELVLYIPAYPFDEEEKIGAAQNLLMVKTSEYENFFSENRTPDNISSFTGVYDAQNNLYYFTSMREYFIELLKKGSITEDDISFTLVPVEITTETSAGYFGTGGTTYVTKCVPYTSAPTATLLKTNDAMVAFSFSTQIIE